MYTTTSHKWACYWDPHDEQFLIVAPHSRALICNEYIAKGLVLQLVKVDTKENCYFKATQAILRYEGSRVGSKLFQGCN